MTPSPSDSVPSTSSAATARNLAALAARAWRLRVDGAPRVPPEGPVLLVANHSGVLDALVLAAASPRPVHVLVAVDPTATPAQRLLRRSGQIPLRDDGPDRAALRTACEVLERGGVVAVFPEGPRGAGDVRHARLEAAYLVARTDAVVVPVAVLGTRPPGAHRDALPRLRGRVDVVYGEPVGVPVDGDRRRRVVVARAGERIRQLLADHVGAACELTRQPLPGPLPVPPHPTRSDS